MSCNDFTLKIEHQDGSLGNGGQVGMRKILRFSEITTCVLYGLIPVFVAVFPNFVPVIIWYFSCLQIYKEDISLCFVPKVTSHLCPNWSGS